MSIPLLCQEIPAADPRCAESRRFEVRHDRIGGTVAPHTARSTYITLGQSHKAPIAVARLISPHEGLTAWPQSNPVGHGGMVWELASFNVLPRYTVSSIGWVGLWAGVAQKLIAERAVYLSAHVDASQVDSITRVSGAPDVWQLAPGPADGLGLSADVTCLTLTLSAYESALYQHNLAAYDLFIEGEGLEESLHLPRRRAALS